ncbi:VanZ family protein [Sporosarcina sp. FA9]|uniref:VanZ family protein n=1 Tax=Sporosarcina sp. FA9 TaxID=3413030 RepID=UPI003F65CCD0
MTAIFEYIGAMLPYLGVALPVILAYRFICVKCKKYKPINPYHEIGVIVFLLFITALFSQTILTSLYTGPAVANSFTNINIKPFQVFHDTYYSVAVLNYWQPLVINFLGNIVIFMPIGFMMPLLWIRFNRFWKVSLFGFTISFFIETIQLTQMRSSDIDDLWLNTLGCMIGYTIYFVTKKIFPFVDSFKNRTIY